MLMVLNLEEFNSLVSNFIFYCFDSLKSFLRAEPDLAIQILKQFFTCLQC